MAAMPQGADWALLMKNGHAEAGGKKALAVEDRLLLVTLKEEIFPLVSWKTPVGFRLLKTLRCIY